VCPKGQEASPPRANHGKIILHPKKPAAQEVIIIPPQKLAQPPLQISEEPPRQKVIQEQAPMNHLEQKLDQAAQDKKNSLHFSSSSSKQAS